MSNLSFREKLYIDIATHIAKIENESGEQYFKTIDLWNNQWEFLADIPSFPFPAVFIEFASLAYKSIGNKIQTSEILIRLHIGDNTLQKSKFTNADTIPEGIVHLRSIDALHFWMGRLQGDYFSSFTRTVSEHDHNHDKLIAHVETYRTMAKDDSAIPVYAEIEGDKLKVSFI